MTLAVLILLSAGCFHASIETGMKPGNDAIEKEWGGPIGIEVIAPSVSEDPGCRKGGASYQRRS